MRALGAVVLAAGASKRFGAENKLLLNIDDEPLIRRVVREIMGSGIAEVLVVTGYEAPRIAAALEGLAVRRAHNENWQSGMGTSVATGIAALSANLDGAFVVPGDLPHLTSGLLIRLAKAFEDSDRHAVIIPVTSSGGQRNPVLWPHRYFPLLKSLYGPRGGKQLLQNLAESCVPVSVKDDRQLSDVDEVDDMAAASQTRCCVWSKAQSR